MSLHTIRLDDLLEKKLEHLVHRTGLSVSSILKKGLLLAQGELLNQSHKHPFSVYEKLDLGQGGMSIAHSHQAKKVVASILKRKWKR